MGNLIAGSCLSVDGIKNCICQGKEPCKCCYCCLNEADKVGRCMDQFPASPVSQAAQNPNSFMKLVGRVVLPSFQKGQAQAQCMYSPGTMKPCVYWRVVVSEQWIRWREVDDYTYQGEGENRRRVKTGSHWESSTSWNEVIDRENYVDFYLQDGTIKLFVHGSQRGHCRIQSEWDAGGGGWNQFGYNNLPPSIGWLVQKAKNFGGWQRNWYNASMHARTAISMPTGIFRWSECAFEVNEKICCLGITSPAYADPYTQSATVGLIPFTKNLMTPEYQAQMGWSTWDRWSWSGLLDKCAAVMLSDAKKYTNAVNVGPAIEIPRWQQVYVPAYSPWGGVTMQVDRKSVV